MSAIESQNDFDAVRVALEKIFEANEEIRRRLYEKGELFNDNFIRFSVADLHKSLENTPRRKLPQLVEKVLADFKFKALHGDWALVKHDAPDFTLTELPNSATNVVGITFSEKGYKGCLIELGDADFGKSDTKIKPTLKVVPKAEPKVKKEVVKPTESKQRVQEEEISHAPVERAPATMLEVKRRRKEVEKLSPEQLRESSGTYQQLKFILLSQPLDALNELAETFNIGELEGSIQQAVNELLQYLEYDAVREAAENMGITLKARNNADAALLEFLIAQSN